MKIKTPSKIGDIAKAKELLAEEYTDKIFEAIHFCNMDKDNWRDFSSLDFIPMERDPRYLAAGNAYAMYKDYPKEFLGYEYDIPDVFFSTGSVKRIGLDADFEILTAKSMEYRDGCTYVEFIIKDMSMSHIHIPFNDDMTLRTDKPIIYPRGYEEELMQVDDIPIDTIGEQISIFDLISEVA